MSATVELKLADAVIRSGHGPMNLAADDFDHATARACWMALRRIWSRGDVPHVEAVVDELERQGYPHRTAALAVLGLPTGEWRLIPDYFAVVRDRARRRRLMTVLTTAIDTLGRGGDPDAIARRVHDDLSPGLELHNRWRLEVFEPTFTPAPPVHPPAWRTFTDTTTGDEPFPPLLEARTAA